MLCAIVVMSIKQICPSTALLQSLRQVPGAAKCPNQLQLSHPRALQTSRRKAEQASSFRGQLYESTQRRLQKEREEQQRLARERGEGNSGRTIAITFGELLIGLAGGIG